VIQSALSVPITFNPRQLEAVEHVHGPMLVVAGAGTGKTTVLVQRIARLIRERHAQPQEILALTFTDNAAAEMAERVRSELAGTDTTGLRASTFHAYCVWLLEKTRHNFAVLEKEDLWIYLRQRMKKLPFQHFAPARNPGEFLDALLEFFDRCQDDLVDPSAFQAWVDKLGDGPVPRGARASQLETMSHEEQVSRWREIAKVCTRVEQMLTEEGLGTFGHQISRTAALLRCDREMLAFARAHARFLLIDEFQDVNVAQVELAQLLAGDSRNIFAVGDPDQAIYHFRGATAAAFTEFQTRFPETRTVVLKDNQRSRTPILKCGYSIIWHNPAAGLKRFGREPLESVREATAPAACISG
jgi:DNA helicase-2/ATP-dependent DNA helicase PcrA